MPPQSGKPKLGSIFVQHELMSAKALDELLRVQQKSGGKRLASLAVDTGKISLFDALKSLSEQLGLPGIDLDQVVLALEDLRVVPKSIAKKLAIVPVSVKEDSLIIAMADAGERRIVEEIEFVTGKRVFPYVALHSSLVAMIDDVYARLDRGDQLYTGKNVPRDHLIALGLDPDRPVTIPPSADPRAAPQHGVVRSDKPLPMPASDELSFAGLFDEETGAPEKVLAPAKAPRVDTLVAAVPEPKKPTLDRAFESRVAPLPARPTMMPEATSGTVLVVDDDDDIRKLLARLLSERGYRVIEASKGLEAVAAVRDREPDLLILDAMLPELHGFDICRRLKGSQKYGHIPIIMISAVYRGWRVAEDLRESFGVYSFIEKPFKIATVLEQVQRALSGRKPHSAAEGDQLSEAARECLERGIEAYKGGDLTHAVELMKKGVSIDPLAYRLHYHLGLLYGRQEEKLFEAIQALQTAVDLSPRSFSALKNLAVLYQRAGFKHKAIEMWERSLTHAPDEETKASIKEHVVSLL